MGRESRFLLTLLGLLAGVFVAALSIRLFSPRPPKGTGPDIHTSAVSTTLTPLVPPPVLTPRPRPDPMPSRPVELATQPQKQLAVTDPPPLTPLRTAPFEQPDSPAGRSRFSRPKTAATLVSNEEPLTSSAPPWQVADQERPQPVQADATTPFQPSAQQLPPLTTRPPTAPAFADPPAQPSTPAGLPPVTPGEPYVVVADDSWWSIAERAYGDGRYYRSLFAWNRTITPSVSLATGTTLEIPPTARLELAWPRLMPAD